jgi:protein TonB
VSHPDSTLPLTPPTGKNLWLGLGISLLLHATLLALNFEFPDASRAFQDQALDIILVNSKSARKPSSAQALAQANLDGGGNSEQNRRVRTPLPASTRQQSGEELEQAEKRVQTLEAQQQRLLAQTRSKGLLQKSGKEGQPEPVQSLSGRDLASNALAMARLEGEIARDTEEYNKRPRVKQLGASAQEYRFAQYIEDWRIKVERVGTLNYPEAAKGKLYGSLRLSVRIRSDGSVQSVEVGRSSGHKILDDAARRIVSMAGPYAAFPPDIRKDFEILEITRIWNFTNSNKLETK